MIGMESPGKETDYSSNQKSQKNTLQGWTLQDRREGQKGNNRERKDQKEQD